MIDFLKEAQEISGELSEIRKTIHRHPELGNQEFKTSALVEAYLNKLGIETRRILGTAIIGTLLILAYSKIAGRSTGLKKED